jgi:hypothetical protein
MANSKDTVPELTEPSAGANPEIVSEVHEVKIVIDRLKGLLEELDALGFPRAATYLSMAIDQIELDFAPKSK